MKSGITNDEYCFFGNQNSRPPGLTGETVILSSHAK